MAYVPPHLRDKSSEKSRNTEYLILDDAEDFPQLSKPKETRKKNHTLTWGSEEKSFKEIVEKNEITFDYNILERKKDETNSEYFNRLLDIFKQTTILHTYDIYVVKNNNKTYRVAARHEIIARFLCQIEDNKYSRKAYDDAYNKFRKNILKYMYKDDELWDDIMWRVGGDSSRRDEAIRLYYNDTHTGRYVITLNWLDPQKTTCKKDSKNTEFSEEMIIY